MIMKIGYFEDDMIKIADHYGPESRKTKCVEECGELIQAIMKDDKDMIIDEAADVLITVLELIYIFDISPEVVERVEFKIKRQLKRMENDEKIG